MATDRACNWFCPWPSTILESKIFSLDLFFADLGAPQEAVTEFLRSLPDDLPPGVLHCVETACKLAGKANCFLGVYGRVFGWPPMEDAAKGLDRGQSLHQHLPLLWAGLLWLCGLGVFLCLLWGVCHRVWRACPDPAWAMRSGFLERGPAGRFSVLPGGLPYGDCGWLG